MILRHEAGKEGEAGVISFINASGRHLAVVLSLSSLLSLFIFNCCSLLLLLLLLLLPAVSSSPAASSAACRGLGAGMNAVVNVFLNVMRLLRN